MMNTIGHLSGYPWQAGASGSVQIAQSTRAAIDTRASAEISLVTADGDKVTLSARTASLATYSTYDYLGRLNGQALAARAENVAIDSSSAFSLTVDGELDPQELADIHKLFDALQGAAADAFSGNSARVAESLTDFAGLDSIASFEAVLSYSRSASAEQTTTVATAAEAPAEEGSATPSAPVAPESRNIRPLLNRLAQIARRLEAEHHFDNMPKRLEQLLKKLAHDPAFAEQAQPLPGL